MKHVSSTGLVCLWYKNKKILDTLPPKSLIDNKHLFSTKKRATIIHVGRGERTPFREAWKTALVLRARRRGGVRNREIQQLGLCSSMLPFSLYKNRNVSPWRHMDKENSSTNERRGKCRRRKLRPVWFCWGITNVVRQQFIKHSSPQWLEPGLPAWVWSELLVHELNKCLLSFFTKGHKQMVLLFMMPIEL